jgi:hypothetical protein
MRSNMASLAVAHHQPDWEAPSMRVRGVRFALDDFGNGVSWDITGMSSSEHPHVPDFSDSGRALQDQLDDVFGQEGTRQSAISDCHRSWQSWIASSA